MKTKIVITRPTLDLMWMLGGNFAQQQEQLGPDEVVIVLDDDVVSHAINIFDDETFDGALRRFLHARLNEGEGA